MSLYSQKSPLKKDKIEISHFITIGDSLSDRGTLFNRSLLFFIPMSQLSGLSGRSPLNRFTNGYAWDDHFIRRIANQFIISELKMNHYTDEDIAEAILYANSFVKKEENPTSLKATLYVRPDQLLEKALETAYHQFFNTLTKNDALPLVSHEKMRRIKGTAKKIATRYQMVKDKLNNYTLENDRFVSYGKNDYFLRSYNEGGLTAHDYSWMPSKNTSRYVSRIILSTLAAKQKKWFSDDEHLQITKEQKIRTLVIEWSGANDLITVNEKPSLFIVKLAIEARIKNLEQAIKKGYRHFILFELPDLSLVPRFQNKLKAAMNDTAKLQEAQQELNNAKICSEAFNAMLKIRCDEMAKMYPHCTIKIYEVNKIFSDVFKNPEKYHFSRELIKIPFTESDEFRSQVNQDPRFIHNKLSPSMGYMFWDDVHPTADTHALLAEDFYKECIQKKFNILNPNIVQKTQKKLLHISSEQLLESFKLKYDAVYNENSQECSSLFCRSRVPQPLALHSILEHALYKQGNRTRKVITDLQWIDEAGNLNLNIPILERTLDAVKQKNKQPSNIVNAR